MENSERSAAEQALDAIVAISREMTWGTDIKALLEMILAEAARISGADNGALYTRDAQKDELRLSASFPPDAESARRVLDVGYGIAGWVAKNATPLRAIDRGTAGGEGGARHKNQLAVPLVNEGEVNGVLSLESYGEAPFTDTQERILTVFAAQAAKAIAAASLIGDLRSERDLLDNILGGTPNGVIALDGNRRVMMINKAAKRFLSIEEKAEEVRGNAVERYLPQKPFLERLRKVLDGQSELENVELNLGEPHESRSYGLKVFLLRRGEENGATVILQDHTEQRKLDEQVQRMGRVASIGQLAAGIAHEIRNPLTGIAITLDILRDQEKLTEGGQEMIGDISREIDRLETLIRGLLDFARPQPAQRRPMRLAKALEWHRTFSEQCRKKGVACSVELDANPKIEGDPERLKQLFLNLAINALDATEPGGTVTIRATLDASNRFHERVKVEVTDTGKGMDAQTVRRIFDPFFTTKNEGTGLGLSIAHSIVEQHQGEMDVVSNPGRGTTFTVELPCHEA